MNDLNELKKQLEAAEAEKADAYGEYMYYECADRGYDAQGASEARKKYNEASKKVEALKTALNAKCEDEVDDTDKRTCERWPNGD